MTREEWTELLEPQTCPFCQNLREGKLEDDFGFTVADLPTGRLRLMRNQFVPGYHIFVSRVHVCEIHEFTAEERRAFFDDLARVTEAIQTAYGAAKLNIEMLGNAVPHLHAHLMPRRFEDANFGKRLGDKRAEYAELEIEAYRRQVVNLKKVLEAF